jgi:hypothetical protein
MSAAIKQMTQPYPKYVPVLIGAVEELVSQRELRNKYETNRSIKTWSAWFLLKSLTTSGKIQRWRKQTTYLLKWLQMSERSFYRRLDEMIDLKIVTLEDDDIILVSYRDAAKILDIPYSGLLNIPYNPENHGGKQIFQYFLRVEEFRYQQERQLSALLYHLDKNPLLKNDLHLLLVKYGADGQQLQRDACYFQERLLKLQMLLFKEGSDILQYILTHRADINRSVSRIQKNHAYKAKQSVSYLKACMIKLKLILVEKKCVHSKDRSRIYIPEGPKKRDGYKWINKTKETAWFLTDQIRFMYELERRKTGEQSGRKAA